MPAGNVSQDLVWQIVNNQNAYMCKRRSAGGVCLSRDPMNLVNKHSRKYEGFVSNEAIGVQARGRGIEVSKKRPNAQNKPALSAQKTTFAPQTSSRKIYQGIVRSTAKQGYRPDLRYEAVARASEIKKSQGRKPVARQVRLRGAKARKAAA